MTICSTLGCRYAAEVGKPTCTRCSAFLRERGEGHVDADGWWVPHREASTEDDPFTALQRAELEREREELARLLELSQAQRELADLRRLAAGGEPAAARGAAPPAGGEPAPSPAGGEPAAQPAGRELAAPSASGEPHGPPTGREVFDATRMVERSGQQPTMWFGTSRHDHGHHCCGCLLYPSDAADDIQCLALGGCTHLT